MMKGPRPCVSLSQQTHMDAILTVARMSAYNPQLWNYTYCIRISAFTLNTSNSVESIKLERCKVEISRFPLSSRTCIVSIEVSIMMVVYVLLSISVPSTSFWTINSEEDYLLPLEDTVWQFGTKLDTAWRKTKRNHLYELKDIYEGRFCMALIDSYRIPDFLSCSRLYKMEKKHFSLHILFPFEPFPYSYIIFFYLFSFTDIDITVNDTR